MCNLLMLFFDTVSQAIFGFAIFDSGTDTQASKGAIEWARNKADVGIVHEKLNGSTQN